jgi:hypothetical protein
VGCRARGGAPPDEGAVALIFEDHRFARVR